MKLCSLTFILSCALVLLNVHLVSGSHLRQKAAALEDLGTWGHMSRSVLREKTFTKGEINHNENAHIEPEEESENPREETGKSDDSDKEGQEDIKSTWDKVLKADLPAKLRRNYYQVTSVFLPGAKFIKNSFIATMIALVLSTLWFAIYFGCRYQDDYEEIDGGRWAKNLENLEAYEEDENLRIKTDVMLVFHHPKFEYPDHAKTVPAGQFDKVMVHGIHSDTSDEAEQEKTLPKLSKLRANIAHERGIVQQAIAHHTPRLMGGEDDGGSQSHGEPTYQEVREALLQDVFKDLYDMGFGLKVFSSIDEDEIFVGVSLRKPEAIRHYLYLQQYSLRIKRDVIPKLGIGQPDDVVPPMLRYDKTTIEGLYESKVLKNPDETELFKTYSGGLLVSTRDRVRLVYGALSTLVDVDAAEHAGFIVNWYPVHNQDWLPRLKAAWANYGLLWDFTFVQPVLSLQSYFGVRVAFIFAWNGLYCKALFALMPLALLSETVGVILSYQPNYDMATVVRMMVLSFNIIIVVWSRIVYNIWEREEQFFLQTWNIHDSVDHIVRPSFHGEWQPMVQDSNKLEKRYPESKFALRQFASFLVTAIFCALVAIFIVVWYDIFDGDLSIFAMIVLMIQMQVFQALWNAITPILTEFENHRYQYSFYDSYLWKNFFFQAVNSYCAYFYIAIKLQHSKHGCPEGSCLGLLRRLLITIQITLTVGNIAWLLCQSYYVRFILWYEVYQYRKANNGEEPPERPSAEKEAKMREFRNREQIESMCTLMLSVGFIFLFGAIAPIMVPFSLLVFSMNLRANAVMLVSYMQRPIPRKQVGIGAWKDVVLVLMKLGIFFSGFLLVVYGDTFKGVPIITRLMGLIIYCLAMFAVWAVVDYIVPPMSKEARDLKMQNQCVIDRIHAKCQEKSYLDNEQTEELRIERKKSFWESPVARSAWSEIRPLAKTQRHGSASSVNTPGSMTSSDRQPSEAEIQQKRTRKTLLERASD